MEVGSRKVVLDTNIYIAWLNWRLDENLAVGPGLVRYLSAVVQMELRAGAVTRPGRQAVDQLLRGYKANKRFVAPDAALFDAAGHTLLRLRARGWEPRRSSLLADVLIAHTARSLGATVLTRDGDFEAIREVLDFEYEHVNNERP